MILEINKDRSLLRGRVLDHFKKEHECSDRSTHQVNSKWKEMCVKVNEVNYSFRRRCFKHTNNLLQIYNLQDH